MVTNILLQENISLQINERELKRLPKTSNFICIGNGLLKGLDRQILQSVLEKQDKPFKIISIKNDWSQELGEVLRQKESTQIKKLFEALAQEKEAGVVVALLLHFSTNRLEPPGKKYFLNQVMKVVKKLELPIVPIRLDAESRSFFQLGLPAKWLKRSHQDPLKVILRVGSSISVEEQERFPRISRFRKFVQSKIFALGSSLQVKPFFRNPFPKPAGKVEKIAEPIDDELIIREIEQLTFEDLITSQSNFDIFVAKAKDIPNVLLEIGRLREITFREVGEGTGKSRDVDEFDLYYHQLIIWDRIAKKIVGGYRMGKGSEIFEHYGLEGFYIHNFFKIKAAFFPIMRASVELGRSYIVSSYQRKRLPLFLLWKGILFFLLKNPQYRYLYGPVSISKYYSNISKSLIIAFIKKYFFNHELAQFLRPRKPFKAKINKVDIDLLMENLGEELQSLDSLIEDIEPEHFRLPVLIRQYMKLNARFISFNIDPNFSDCLDGFIILDLREVPYTMIEALKKEA